jgi:hypothetical protein
MIERVARDTAIVCVVMALAALAWMPGRPRVALGVVGGGVLVGLTIWALAGLVNGLVRRDENGEFRPVSRGSALVKLFTRHGILALVAYVMMVRLHLDPVAMLVGVTSVVVAAALAARRPR